MVGHGAKFGRKKEEAIAALLSQRNIEEAARVAGIGHTTLLRWLQVPEFDAAYRKARRAAHSQSIARLQQASSAAVAALLKVMVDPNTPASSRVRAADCVLDHSAKAIELGSARGRAGAGGRGIKIGADAVMRSALLRRLRALEAKSPDPTESRKPLLPPWLIEEAEKQGVRFDASGFPEKIGWNPALNFGGLDGIQRAQLEKS